MRTIGQNNFFTDLWARVRLPIVQQWEETLANKMFASTRAGDCEATRWAHNIIAAWANAKGLVTGTAVLDISKFYENIRHQTLFEEAQSTRYNLALLRGLLLGKAWQRNFSKLGGRWWPAALWPPWWQS